MGAVRKSLAERMIGRRVVALIAAYAIALSSLIASFVAANAATAEVTGQDSAICHSVVAGHPSPIRSTDDAGGKTCPCCCIGCLMLTAAVPPPPVAAVAIVQSSGRAFEPQASVSLVGRPEAKSHRQRAPPRKA